MEDAAIVFSVRDQLPVELTWLGAVGGQRICGVVDVLVVVQEAILGLAEQARWDISSTGKHGEKRGKPEMNGAFLRPLLIHQSASKPPV